MSNLRAAARGIRAAVAALLVASVTIVPAAADDGISWAPASEEETFGGSLVAADIEPLGTGAALVGASGEGKVKAVAWLMDSDGAWTAAALEAPKASEAKAIAIWPGGLAIVGNRTEGKPRGLIWTSPDGAEWKRSTVKGVRFLDISAVPGGIAIVGTEDDTVGGTKYAFATMWTSGDGKDWTPSRISFGADQIPQRIAVSDAGTHIVAGYGAGITGVDQPTYWLSEDGSSWRGFVMPTTSRPEKPRYDVTDLESTPLGFLAVLQTHDAGDGEQAPSVSSVLHSPDGSHWDEVVRSEPYEPDDEPAIASVSPIGAGAVAVGQAGKWSTHDGIEWAVTPEPAFDGYLVSSLVLIDDGRVLAAGRPIDGGGAATSMTWVGRPGE
jgi:hypothetical protein